MAINAVNKYPLASSITPRDREKLHCPNNKTAVIRSVMTSEPSYTGMKAQTCTSGVFANGTAARNIATDRSTTVNASPRSLGPAGNPAGNTRRPSSADRTIGIVESRCRRGSSKVTVIL